MRTLIAVLLFSFSSIAFPQTSPVFQAPASVDFGPGLVGIPFTRTAGCCSLGAASITNAGNATLTINSITILGTDFIIGEFSITPPILPTAIAPGASAGVPMVFVPTAAGKRTATLVIQDNASGSPHQIQLTGVGVASGDFGVGSQTGTENGSNSATVTAGQTATYVLSIAAASGFTGTVTLSCSGLPTGAACNSTPLALTGPALTGTNLSIATTARGTAFLKLPPFSWAGLWCSVAALFGLLILRYSNRRQARALVALPALLLLASIMSCGGGGGGGGGGGPTPAGTYTIVVNGSANGTTHSTNLTLIVQ